LLHDNAAFFRNALAIAPGDYIVPVVLGDDARAVAAAEKLQSCGWDVRAIRPPSVPPGTARLRIAIHADHDRDTLAALAAAIREVAQ
jgi:8-amino-7-oxononanoate synthase